MNILSIKRILVALIAFSIMFFSTQETHTVYAASGDAIEYVKNVGYMNGYPDGTFGEEKLINRAELTEIVVHALYSPAEIEECYDNAADDVAGFKDIQKDLWFAPSVCVAAQHKIISGYADGTFKAGNPVTFVEASKMILAGFTDVTFTPDSTHWFAPYVTYLSDKHAIPADVTSLVTPITRGNIAEIIYRIETDTTDLPSNAYEPTTVCILEMQGRFYGKTAKDVFFYTPTHALYSGSGALFGNESRKEILIQGNGRLVKGADATTFQGLEMGYYGKDAQKAFYLGMMLQDSDGKTFQTLDTLFGYAKDTYSAYYQGQKVLGSDPASFVSLGAYFAKDKNSVYYFGQKFEGADAKSFEVINAEYQRDANSGYFRGKKIEGSAGATFKVLNVSFAKDNNFVYFNDMPVVGANPAAFSVLKDHYGTDDTMVYFENMMMPWVEKATFEVLDDFYAKDAGHFYYSVVEFSAERDTFQVLAKGYAKDKNAVYFRGGKINADPVTFSVNIRGVAKDKNHTFVEGIAQ